MMKRLFRGRFTVDDKESNIGNILLRMDLVTLENIEQAIETQKANDLMLGAALVFIGAITKDDVDRALVLQGKMRSGQGGEALLDIQEKRTNEMHARMCGHLKLVGEKS